MCWDVMKQIIVKRGVQRRIDDFTESNALFYLERQTGRWLLPPLKPQDRTRLCSVRSSDSRV